MPSPRGQSSTWKCFEQNGSMPYFLFDEDFSPASDWIAPKFDTSGLSITYASFNESRRARAITCTGKELALPQHRLEGLPSNVMVANYKITRPNAGLLENELRNTRRLLEFRGVTLSRPSKCQRDNGFASNLIVLAVLAIGRVASTRSRHQALRHLPDRIRAQATSPSTSFPRWRSTGTWLRH